MSGTTDKVKGRVEEAAGVLTNDRKLKNRGKMDQAAGNVAAGNVKDAIGKTIDKAVAAVNHDNKRSQVAKSRKTNAIYDSARSNCSRTIRCASDSFFQ